jgi:hypothetical protein
MNSKNFIIKIVMTSLVLMATLISANANVTEEQKKIFGVWQLSTADKNFKQIKPEFFALPIDFAPESLVLATDENVTEITINEGFKDFINTQTLPTNGTVITKNIDRIGKISSKAYWSGKRLVVEIATAKGHKITETFEVSANQKQLIVTVQTKGNGTAKATKTRRVYQRVAEQSEDRTAQVGITVYPF